MGCEQAPKQTTAGLSDSHLDTMWPPDFMNCNIIKGRELSGCCSWHWNWTHEPKTSQGFNDYSAETTGGKQWGEDIQKIIWTTATEPCWAGNKPHTGSISAQPLSNCCFDTSSEEYCGEPWTTSDLSCSLHVDGVAVECCHCKHRVDPS